jgi:hypothetical protein
MFSKLAHNFRLGLPIMVIALLCAMASIAVVDGSQLALLNQPASMFMVVVGSAADQVYHSVWPLTNFMQRAAQESDILSLIALVATLISLLAVLVHFFKAIRGSGDAVGFVASLLDRIRLVSWRNTPWGIVRDIDTGHPLPFTRIGLLANDGSVIAQTVANSAGRFGFPIPLRQAFMNGYSLEAKKSGHYFPPSRARRSASLANYCGGNLPRIATILPERMDLLLEAKHEPADDNHALHGAVRMAGTVAFWVSMLTVPMAAIVAPNAMTSILIGGLAVSMLTRLGGLGRTAI